MVRTPCCDKTGLKKGTWTPEEDRKLAAYINRYGSWNWRQLPKFAGLSRCGKSCRLRWMNYLRPNLKRGNFSKEEEQLVIKLHESLGNRWSAIAAKLSGRTDNEIKNYWHTYLKKLSRPIQGDRPNSNHRSKRKAMAEKISDPSNNSLVNPSTDHQILESSQFPLHEISPSDLCSLMADTAPESSSSFEENELSPSDLCSLMADIVPESSPSFEENEVWPSNLCSLMEDAASENSKGFEKNETTPSELRSLMIDNASENSTSFEENKVSPDKMFFEDIENWWMEPFLEDIYHANYSVAPLLGTELLDTEFLSLNTPYISDELLCSYGLSDEYVTKF